VADRRSITQNAPDTKLPPEDVQALLGEELPAEQDAVIDRDEFVDEPETTDTDRYLGEADRPGRPDDESVDDALTGLRGGETDNPIVASDEGLSYVPPMDPPVRPSEDDQGIEVAAGIAESALGDPYDDSHRAEDLTDEADLTGRVREALEADAATSELADRIRIAMVGGVAVLRGTVDSIDDGDALVEVASRVSGVTEVRDETEVAGL
jgi:BON domain-containing protein